MPCWRQLLPASAYPVDIVQVSRWLAKNKASVDKGDFTALDAQSWDPSVKALARFPTVIDRMNTDLDATTDLGDAFVNQPDDVAAVIQALRLQAQKAGTLQSTPQQRVTVQAQDDVQYVVIEPADPEVLYVPTYDPAVVYNPGANAAVAGLIGFGLGVAVGSAIDNPWDWRRGYVYPPRWAGYPGYRPGVGGVNVNGNVNIGNSVNIGERQHPPLAARQRPLSSRPGQQAQYRQRRQSGRTRWRQYDQHRQFLDQHRQSHECLDRRPHEHRHRRSHQRDRRGSHERQGRRRSHQDRRGGRQSPQGQRSRREPWRRRRQGGCGQEAGRGRAGRMRSRAIPSSRRRPEHRLRRREASEAPPTPWRRVVHRAARPSRGPAGGGGRAAVGGGGQRRPEGGRRRSVGGGGGHGGGGRQALRRG